MKKHEISAAFNQEIAKAVASGFAPSMTELTGSYSDVLGSQMVFAKGNKRIILWMGEEYGYGQTHDIITANVAHITLGKGEQLEYDYRWSDSWKEHLVSSEVYYKIDDDWYTEDLAEADAAEDKRHERWMRKPERIYSDWVRIPLTDGILGVARHQKGFKTVKADNLRVERCRSRAAWKLTNITSGNQATIG